MGRDGLHGEMKRYSGDAECDRDGLVVVQVYTKSCT